MTIVKKYQQALRTINIEKIVRKILIDNKQGVFEILQNKQLGKGLDSSGNLIGRYSEATDAIASSSISIAKGEKPKKEKIAGQPYNFEWTGDLFIRFGLKFESLNTYTLFSASGKTKLLEDKYGNIFDLTNQHNREVNNKIILPELEKVLTEKFNVISRNV